APGLARVIAPAPKPVPKPKPTGQGQGGERIAELESAVAALTDRLDEAQRLGGAQAQVADHQAKLQAEDAGLLDGYYRSGSWPSWLAPGYLSAERDAIDAQRAAERAAIVAEVLRQLGREAS